MKPQRSLPTYIILFLFVAPAILSLDETVKVYQTVKNTEQKLSDKDIPLFQYKKSSDKDEFVINLNTRKQYQQIWGFGAAFTDAVADVLYKLPKNLREEVLNAFFGPEGNNYNLARIPVGSSDFSVKPYSLAPEAGDFQLKSFNLSHGIYHEQVFPLLRQAMQLRERPESQVYDLPVTQGSVQRRGVRDDDIQIFATPWTAPAWMKRNNKLQKGAKPRGLKEGDQYMEAYALYVSKFVQALKDEKFKVWAVTPQNEPEAPSWWEACYFTPELSRDYIGRFFGPRIKKDHEEVDIMFFDDQKTEIMRWADIHLKDAEAKKYISGAAVHWYFGPGFKELAKFHEAYPNQYILASEQTNGFLPYNRAPNLGNWNRGEYYSHDIIGDLNNWAVGWVDWNFVLDLQGGPNHESNFCDAPIIADIEKQKLHYQPMYYHLAHFSRFIPRYSVRIDLQATGGPIHDRDRYWFGLAGGPLTTSAVQSTAFLRPDGQIAMVILNRMRKSHKITTVVDNNMAFKAEVPGRSIMTFVIPNAAVTKNAPVKEVEAKPSKN
ncbi:glycoside hydrolase [Paraphysoderma sedebokerense]|nr:glycoside hydrolase [Paraphysoderma sedebokerense]